MSPLRINIIPEKLEVPLADLQASMKKSKVRLGLPIQVQPLRYPPIRRISWYSNAPLNANGANIALSSPLQIWTFPDSMTTLKQAQTTTEDVQSSLPEFFPQPALKVEKLDPSTGVMKLMDPSSYHWNFATKIELRIKRISSIASASKLTAFTYELVGVKESDIVLLERMLQNKDELNAAGGFIKLLYPSVKKGELTSGSHNVDLFLMQFNLSKETNPSRSFTQPTAGNDDAFTFVSKLWEGTITRSGGYYLFYYDQELKNGLPDHLFGESQEALISLLLVFPDTAESKFQIRSYTNCVVSGGIENDNVDLQASASSANSKNVYMEVVRTQVSLTYEPQFSLRQYANVYYSDPAEIAEDNAGIVIVDPSAELLVIDGIYTASADSPRDLVSIANRFGIEKENLLTLNRGITENADLLGIPLRLPSKVYSNVRNLAAGDGSFQAIASFFGTTAASLAQSNQDRSHLFIPGSSLTIRTGPTSRTPQLPQGVIELTSQRVIPREDPNVEHDSKAYVETLYHMLGYVVEANDSFINFDPGLPISPVEHDQLWRYSKAIPYTNLAINKDNSKRNNPYYGVGSLFQLRYVWKDVFGNQLANNDDPEGTLLSALIFFTDPLLGPSQWPGVSTAYYITPGKVNKEIADLTIQFRYQLPMATGEKKDQVKRQALENCIALYRAAAQILHRLPSIQGSDETSSVQCTVVTSLLTSSYSLSFTERESLARWLLGQVKALIDWAGIEEDFTEYVALPVEIAGGQVNAQHNLVVEIPLSKLNPVDIFELTTEFVMNRELAYVLPSLRGNSEISRSVTAISPARSEMPAAEGRDNQAAAAPLLAFATKLEKALQINGVFGIKAAVGSNRKHWHAATTELPIWLIRLALAEGKPGLRLDISGSPVVYSPRPLTNVAESVQFQKTWQVGDDGALQIIEGQAEDDVAETINMEWRARGFLTAVDEMLSPSFMSAFEQLYKYGSTTTGTKTHYMNELLKLKEQLAGIIAKQLSEVFSGERRQTSVNRDKAIEKFSQQLKMELTKAYHTDAIVQFEQANARGSILDDSSTSASEAKWKSKIYGEVIPKPEGGTTFQDNIVLSQPKVEIHPEGAVMADTTMSFVVSGYKEDAALSALSSYVSFDAGFWPTHIEHQIAGIEGIPEYEASSWLYFVKPEHEDANSRFELYQPFEDVIEVPLPLRAYPESPSLNEQTCIDPLIGANHEHVSPLPNELKWDYSLAYSRSRHYPQDRVYVKIRFNGKPDAVAFTDTKFNDLRTVLEQFNECYPVVRKVLIEQINKWDLNSIPSELWDSYAKPYDSMNKMTAEITSKWSEWVDAMESSDDSANATPSVFAENEYQFYIEERDPNPTDERSEWVIVLQELNTCPFGLTPRIEIDGYTAQMDIVDTEGEAAAERRKLRFSFNQKNDPSVRLEAAVGIAIPRREIRLEGLNILKARRAKTSFYITRNEELIPGRKNAAPFVYRTTETMFTKHLLPLLIRDYPIPMNSGRPVRRRLLEHLAEFFQMLFGKTELEEFPLIQMECTCSYRTPNDAFSIRVPVAQMANKACNPKQDFMIREGDWTKTYLLDTETEPSISSLIYNVATLIWNFIKEHKPSRHMAQVHFKIDIMAPYDNDPKNEGHLKNRPIQLLQLQNVYLDLDQISDLPEGE